MDFSEWVHYGVEQGWIGPIVCAIHDGVPTSLEEDYSFDTGEDPCIWITRVYDDAQTKLEVEANHAPSVWRNRGD